MSQTLTTAQPISQIIKELPIQPLPKPKPNSNSSSTKTAKDCQSCQGINECRFPGHRGYRPVTTEQGTCIQECRHLTNWKTARRFENLTNAGNIPTKHRNQTFADFKIHQGNTDALVAALQMTSLYISGGSQSGKTFLLSLIGNEHLKQGTEARYITTAELLLQLNYNRPDCEQQLRLYQTVPVLLLDDLGLERRTEFADEQLYLILEGRIRQANITVVASHLKLTELATQYTEHVANRIKQTTQREAQMSNTTL